MDCPTLIVIKPLKAIDVRASVYTNLLFLKNFLTFFCCGLWLYDHGRLKPKCTAHAPNLRRRCPEPYKRGAIRSPVCITKSAYIWDWMTKSAYIWDCITNTANIWDYIPKSAWIWDCITKSVYIYMGLYWIVGLYYKSVLQSRLCIRVRITKSAYICMSSYGKVGLYMR